MSDPHFFGYGSLVNRATHAYPDAAPARLQRWRRVWCRTSLRDVAFLSVVPDRNTEIEGLVARVPGADWAALDERERAYDRHDVSTQVNQPAAVQVYAVPERNLAPTGEPPALLLSYVDVVVQGYLQVFGETGVERFFATTGGWAGAALLDDRADPRYPRHQVLSATETALVDRHLTRCGVIRNAH